MNEGRFLLYVTTLQELVPFLYVSVLESGPYMDRMEETLSAVEDLHSRFYSGQQIRSKIDSFQSANFLISQPNPMMLPLIGIVSWLRNEKVIMKTVLFTFS